MELDYWMERNNSCELICNQNYDHSNCNSLFVPSDSGFCSFLNWEEKRKEMEQESRGDYPDAFKWIGEIWELLRLQWTIPMLEQTGKLTRKGNR